MKKLPLPLLAALVAAVLSFMVGVDVASATALTGAGGATLGTGTAIAAENEGTVTLDPPFGAIECNESKVEGSTTNAGGTGVAVTGNISALSFSSCNATVTVINNGGLSIEGTGSNNGTLSSTGTEVTVEFIGTHCIFKTSNTSLGTITGSSTTGGNATLDISATIPRTGGRSGAFCGSTAAWTGSYKFTNPSTLNIDEGGGGGGGEACQFELPSATTEAASFITSHAADLHGTVNPHGCETSYLFEYGTTTSYGTLSGGSSGSGTSSVAETNTVAGLLASTTYHYRISATNRNGTTHGSDKTFTTSAEPPPTEKPSVTTESATGITKAGATLNGSVNPHGSSSTYWFEYGTSTAYGKTTASGSAGSGTSNVKESKEIGELTPGTTYHFRIVASNANGTTNGSDKTFTTSLSGWATQSTPNPTGAKSSRLTFGSCTASTACTSVGEYVNSSGIRVPLAERWNGSAWSAQTPPNPSGATASELLGVACTTSTSCAAAGFYNESSGARHALAEGWNGSEWVLQTTASPSGATSTELSAISCSSSTACTAVGHYTTSTSSVTLAERWNGTSWTVQTTPNPSGATESALLGVSCTASTACTATGYYYNSSGTRQTLAESWNGSAWSIQTTPNRTGATGNILLGVSCTSSTACTAVGGDFPSSGPQETLVERWNGTEWSIQASQNPTGSEASILHGVSCVSASVCMAVGDYVSSGANVTLAEIWNGSSWSLQSTPNPSGATFSALWSVACTSSTECIAPGYYKDSAGTEWALTERSS